MRILDLFESANEFEPDNYCYNFKLYKKYVVTKTVDGTDLSECTLYFVYTDESGVIHIEETLPFKSVFVIADNGDMKAKYIRINDDSQAFDQLQFTESYDKIKIFIPRDDTYSYEVETVTMSESEKEIFNLPAEYQEVFIVEIDADSAAELEKHILLT